MPKPIVLSPHAHRQLAERGLAKKEVTRTVEQPEQLIPNGNRLIAQRRITHAEGLYLLRVIYEEDAEQIIVVTVYQTSKVNKYWRQP